MSDKNVCGKCGAPFSLEQVATASSESRVVFSLKPHPGERMKAETISGTLESLSKLLVEASKPFGMKAVVLVDGITTKEDGQIDMTLIVARVAKD